jgi:hypothetical protein
MVQNMNAVDIAISHHDRIAQGELVKTLEYTIEETHVHPQQKGNRKGGFGSTGI